MYFILCIIVLYDVHHELNKLDLFKETLLALVRDLFTFLSKVIKRFIIV
jgi:hypothetical protein